MTKLHFNKGQRICIGVGVVLVLILLTHPPYTASVGELVAENRGHINIFAGKSTSLDLDPQNVYKNVRINFPQMICEIFVVISSVRVGIWTLKDREQDTV